MAGETTTWLKRTDARVSTSIDGTVRSQDGMPMRCTYRVNMSYLGGRGFGQALTAEGVPIYITGCSHDALVGLRQKVGA